MKILFTGASSFSGMWFVYELARAGHEVIAIFPRPYEEYQGLRKIRVDQTIEVCRPVFSCSFGSPSFIDLISETKCDLLCHHAANVTNYKSSDFDFTGALATNTMNIQKVFASLCDQGCNRVLLTGSVFEQNEGEGSDELRAVSPYGLSKGLTSDVFRYFATIYSMKLGKFVIPNPFGPYEEPRFTTYLAKSWFEGKVAKVSSPLYIRDNVPVTLLAKAYTAFVMELTEPAGFQKINPSFYIESQGEFTHRFSHEISQRLRIPCPFKLEEQNTFLEPIKRVNTDRIHTHKLQWSESHAWDQLAEFYQKNYGEVHAHVR